MVSVIDKGSAGPQPQQARAIPILSAETCRSGGQTGDFSHRRVKTNCALQGDWFPRGAGPHIAREYLSPPVCPARVVPPSQRRGNAGRFRRPRIPPFRGEGVSVPPPVPRERVARRYLKGGCGTTHGGTDAEIAPCFSSAPSSAPMSCVTSQMIVCCGFLVPEQFRN